MTIMLRNSIIIEEFDYNYLKFVLADYKNSRVKINQLLKTGAIIRVKKGLYVFGPELARDLYLKETLANLIYGPSYISLDYALSFYGLIPERVETITSVTNKRKKIFDTPVGLFSYRYLHPRLYPIGITLRNIDKHHSILMATIEKAISDKLYFSDKLSDLAQMRVHVFDNLRFDPATLKTLNCDRLKELAAIYGHNVKLFYQFWEAQQ